MAGGRPKKIGDEVCSCQGFESLGFSYFKKVPKDDTTYFYPRFRHNDRSINDHDIKNWGPIQELTEYNSVAESFTIFSQRAARSGKVYPIVIYDLSMKERIPDFVGLCSKCFGHCSHVHDLRCTVCNNSTITWCPKCHCHWDFSSIIQSAQINRILNLDLELQRKGIPKLKLKDIFWFLKTSKRIGDKARKLLHNLCDLLEGSGNDFIITFGESSIKEADKISKLTECDMTYLIDKYGILKRLEKKVHTRNKQKETYNRPKKTLPEPIDLPSVQEMQL